MANTKPFVHLACVCEKAVQEKDGVLTVIRVIDTVFAGVTAGAPPNAVPVLQYDCVIAVKSGDLVGTFNKLAIRMNMPSGESKFATEGPIPTTFTGGAHGANVVLKLVLEIKKYGLAWFDVLWGDEVLTRIPLDIKPLSEAPGVR